MGQSLGEWFDGTRRPSHPRPLSIHHPASGLSIHRRRFQALDHPLFQLAPP